MIRIEEKYTMFKKVFALILAICMVGMTAAGCGGSDSDKTDDDGGRNAVVTNLPKLDMTGWQYSEDHGLYYQIGVSYCETPADEHYEKLAIFVPEAYMDAEKNSDGSYTCKLNESAEVSGYTALTAPMLMPVITPGYLGCIALTEQDMDDGFYMNFLSEFTSRGFVCVYPGCRGIAEGVPTGVTDLKAAVRYLRYADDVIAGDAESIFAFGTSGGGAQAAVLGASGDSELYDPYLEKIGAVQGVSDAIAGTMAWCPVTDVDTGNAAYEWMMGCTRTGRSKEDQAISDKLAEAYADYVNSAGFTDGNGSALTLERSADGIYQAGTYYDYLKRVIERSLNNYLSDTVFYNETAEDYIAGLNKDKKWISYDKSTNTATITSIADFVKTCKIASDQSFAFDRPHTLNTLFGYGDGEGAHFDSILADILTELNVDYASEFTDDLKKTDSFGYTVEQRVNMYSPLYYLMESRGGYGTSTVAKYWRIRSGIKQNTNALTTEVNLALALEHCDGVESVDFETVWAQGHTEAERTGDPTQNLMDWIDDCMKG